jgi:hypothetical protein
MTRKARWPDRQTRLDDAKRGIIDDTEDAVSFLDLEDWEIRGEPPPSPVIKPKASGEHRRSS